MLQLKEKLFMTLLLAMTYTCKLWPHEYHQVLTWGITAHLRVHLRSQHNPVLPLHNAGQAADVFWINPYEVITEMNKYIYTR